jgi:hypothetical protein
MKRRIVAATACGLVLGAAGFVWGALAVRYRVFPYGLLRAVVGRPVVEKEQAVKARPPALDALRSLGYVSATFDPDSQQRGVVLHDPELAYPGLNFYWQHPGASALLIDMSGHVVHRWEGDPRQTWQHVELLSDGRILATVGERRLEMRAADSRLLWSLPIRAHHDLWLDEDGIWMNTRVERVIPAVHPTVPTSDDQISHISLEGDLLAEWSLVDAMLRSPYRFLVPAMAGAESLSASGALDVLHTNHVEVIRKTVPALEVFRAGNFLVSFRNIHTIAVLERGTLEPIWMWGPGQLTFQHQPQLLASGNVLIFDNGLERSRILELEPDTLQLAWSYAAEDFFSETRGGVQRLPNGNTLITESNTGWAFEVTSAGQTVWSFANPDVDEQGMRNILWRMTRLDAEPMREWLRPAGDGS